MDERALLQAGFRYALSLRATRADAEDLVQEAWCRLYRRAAMAPTKPEMFVTIRRLFLDQHRRNRLVVFENLDCAPEAADPAAPLDERILPRDLAGPLGALRPVEREALFLTVVEGYTAQEVADLTDSARGTVLSLVHRAKAKLRAALGGDAANAAKRKVGGLDR